jgi:hypothetical protein
MRKHNTREVLVIADGKCKFIGETRWDKSDCAREPLPEGMQLLLCLLEGAERRQDLLRRWSAEARLPMKGDMSLFG